MNNAPQTAAQTDVEQHPLARKWLVIFGFTAVSGSLGTLIVLPYLSFFATEYLKLPFGLLAVLMTAQTAGSWIASLFTGAIVQSTNTKWGKYRPFLAICPLGVLFFYGLIFYGVPGSDIFKTVLIIICYSGAGFCYQSFTVAQQGALALVAGPSTANRLRITSSNAVVMRVSQFLTGLLTGPFIQWATPKGLNPFFILTLLYNGLAAIGYFVLCFALKDIDVYDPNFKKKDAEGASSNYSIAEMYKTTFTNRHFLVYFLSTVISMIGTNMITPLNSYYFKYSLGSAVFMGLSGMALMSVQSTVSTPVGIASAAVARPFAKRIGKKGSTLFVRYFAVVTGILTALFTDGNFIAKLIIFSVSTFSLAIQTAWGQNIVLDISEYQTYETGKDMRSFILGMNNIPSRFAAIIAGPIAPFLLSRSGYDQVAGTFSNTKGLVMFIGLAPAICSLISGILFHIGYGLTDEKAEEYAAANAKRKAEAATAAAPE